MSIDLKELQESARQVLDKTELAAPEDQTWPLLVELGWLLVAVPEDLGGLGQSADGACVLQAELGRRLATAPYLPALLALDAVCQSGRPDAESWVERLSTGDYVAAALAESSLIIEQGKLSGLASAVQSADKASHVLISSEDCVALVPIKQDGVEVTERATWDKTRRLFDVQFAGVELDPELVLASGAAGSTLARRLATLRDFALAADAVGGANSLLALTVEHLETRQQFGRPLALFQALKHRCADLKTLVAGAEAALFDSLRHYAEGMDDSEAATKGKMAKYLAGSAFSTVAEEALQLHGGIGMASEHPCHLFLKRALLSEHLGRKGEHYELEIAHSLLKKLLP